MKVFVSKDLSCYFREGWVYRINLGFSEDENVTVEITAAGHSVMVDSVTRKNLSKLTGNKRVKLSTVVESKEIIGAIMSYMVAQQSTLTIDGEPHSHVRFCLKIGRRMRLTGGWNNQQLSYGALKGVLWP